MFRLCETRGGKSFPNVRTKVLAKWFVMCEHSGMKPSTSELAEKAGISKSYASEIVNGKRPPSRGLAIHIFRQTGWKPEPIAMLTDAEIDDLERLEKRVA